MLKTVNRNFLKKNRKNPIFLENQCRTMMNNCISRIFHENSYLKLWTLKKIIFPINNVKNRQ